MTDWQEHLIIGPIVLPMLIAAAMLLFDERRRLLKGGLSLFAMAAILAMALALLHESATGATGGGDTARVYQLGDWPAPFGIVLVADRLSTLMVALTSVLGACSMIFALARWDRAGPRFHALFLLLVMGVNGAFLTGDLFNLFVFFEIMLAASYGLALHGSGEARIRAGLAYIAVNLTASMLFLIGVSLIYGVTGTLNMADLAVRIPQIAEADRGLFHVGAAVLGVAFLTKCAMWPLGFWLTTTYSAASAPAAAVFAILSKVGAYVIIRLSFLLFAPDSGASAGFGQLWILLGGLATIGFGTAGIIAARDLSIAAAYAVIVSSGTVLAAVGIGNADVLGGAVFYLVGSTLACGALFMLAEVLNRGQDPGARSGRAVFEDEYIDPFDDEERNEPGLVIPAAVAALGGEIDAPCLVSTACDGKCKASVAVPAGAQTGKTVRIKGKGMPHLNGRNRGDLVVELFVETPTDLTARQRELLEELALSFGEGQNPRNSSFAGKAKRFWADILGNQDADGSKENAV